ncbi:hypothetical protein D4R71_07275 [bacterium]|nr:MAG: hypothetical protein D4R71_07275 [bacterium]
MKKKAQVTIVLIFVLSLFLSSTLLTFDSYVGPTKESDELYWDSVMSFFDEFSETVFKIPEDPEDNIGGKNDETASYRRGHRIRISPSERNKKKSIEISD